jgi:Domain of unknown function (DUF4386)
MQQQTEASPALLARLAGALYLVIVVVGVFGQAVVRDRLVVPGNADATAANVLANETLWRLSVSGELGYLALAVVVSLLLYVLFRPVHRSWALLGLSFNLVAVAVEVVARFMLLAPLVFLGKAPYLQAFEPQQLHALAYAFIRLHSYGFGLSLIFFGCVCLTWGYLIRRSGYFPVVIGWLMQLAGVCYLVNSFALLAAPGVAAILFPAILLPPLVAEVSFGLWMLLKGVDRGRWLTFVPTTTRPSS